MRRLYLLRLSALILGAVFTAHPASAIYGIDDKYLVKDSPVISMDFKDAELADVLKILSQQSGMNFVADSSLGGKKINLYLDHVPVDEALEKILSSNNLTYELETESRIFVVKPLPALAKELMTRIYYLKYATVPSSKLKNMLDFNADTEGLTGSSSSSSSSSGGSGSSSYGGATVDKKSGILAAVKTVLSLDGSVIEDERTNSLIVSDIPSRFPAIEQTIARLDIRVAQVLIEVEMLDVSKNDADKIGVKFGESPLSFQGAAKDTRFPFHQAGAPTYDVGTLSYAGLTMTMQFLKTQTDAKSLAHPKIMTLNNETAEIRIVTDEAIALNQTQTSAEGSATTSLEAERVETGVFLRVTPQINSNNNEITMAIEPKVVQAKDGDTFSGQTVKDPETRGTKSILRVKDGDTVVIGGLIRNEDSQTVTKVPGLSSIPILGTAFRHKSKSEEQRELIVFITPHIMRESGNMGAPQTASAGTTPAPQMSGDRLNAVNKELLLFEKQGSEQ